MHQLGGRVYGTNNKGGSWPVIREKDGREIGRVEVEYLPDGRRTVRYVDKLKDVDQTVELPHDDHRDDEQIAKDTVFAGKAGGKGVFRPA